MLLTVMDKKQFVLITLVYILCSYTTIVSGGKLKYLDVNENPLVNTDNENPTPILGILTQEVSKLLLRNYPNKSFTSYIGASYVKFVEGAGGRVVPIWIGQPRDYYKDILSKINGVLLPGGITNFTKSLGYADAGRHIYEFAMELNDNGTYFPVWGTCLGFELFVFLSANSTDPRIYCSSKAQALPLEFTEGYENSHLFRNASTNIIDILKNYPVTANSHNYCVTKETFDEMKLNETWNVLSVNHDWDGGEFISIIEHREYPFYATQFHPEKNIYEFIPNHNIPHTSRAIQTSQYFADFLVAEARRNCQHFANKTEEANTLIYNYSPVYTGLVCSSIVQQYLFESERSSANSIMQCNLFIIFLSVISVIGIYKMIVIGKL